MHLRLVEHLLLGIYFTMLFSITVFSIELCKKSRCIGGIKKKIILKIFWGGSWNILGGGGGGGKLAPHWIEP